jgi:hypothetical protein
MGQVSPWVNADIVYDSPEQGHRTPIQTSSWCHLATLRRETAINIVSSFQVSRGLKQAGRQWYGVMYRAFADFDCKKLKPIQLLLPPLWVTHSHPGILILAIRVDGFTPPEVLRLLSAKTSRKSSQETRPATWLLASTPLRIST